MRLPQTRGGRPLWYRGWPLPPDMVVLHYSGTGTAAYTYEILVQRGLSVHATIERTGQVFRHVDDVNRCKHVGAGSWAGRSSLNSRALGIEIVNFGPSDGPWNGEPSPHPVFDWARDRPNDPELLPDPEGRTWWRDETYGGRTTRVLTQQTAVLAGPFGADLPDHRGTGWWTTYPTSQVEAVAIQVANWGVTFGVLPEYVVGHEHVSPGRKTDPGPAFPWRLLHQRLERVYADEAPHLLDEAYCPSLRIRALQSHLARFGLPVGHIDGLWGPLTRRASGQALDRFRPHYGWPPSLIASKDQVSRLCRAFVEVPGG